MYDVTALDNFSEEYAKRCMTTDRIDGDLFEQYGVKRGLRDKNGNGVLAGLSILSRIEAFHMEDGKKVPCEGNLWYRGYNVIDLV